MIKTDMINYLASQKLLLAFTICAVTSCNGEESLRKSEEAHLIFPDSKESANIHNGSLIPSFMVQNILSRLDEVSKFSEASSLYVNGYAKQMAQIITGNLTFNYKNNQDIWFRYGAEDAIIYVENAKKSGESVSFDSLLKFGYQKIKINGTYNVLAQLEYGKNGNRFQTYAKKNLHEKFMRKVLEQGRGIQLELIGWLSPLGYYDSESIQLPRIFVIENISEETKTIKN